MKIFISWSGERSHAVSEALYDWLPSVLQAVEPWLSSEDIQKGSRWPVEVGNRLGDANFGIFCLTPENISAPWLNFEAGAVSKSMAEGSVATVLLDLKSADVSGPLAQFQHTKADQSDLRKLIRTVNRHLQVPLSEAKVDAAFDRWWSELEAKIEDARSIKVDLPQRRSERDILEEILSLVRIRDRVPAELSGGGIQRVVANFHTIEWELLLESASRIDLMFAYGAGWRSAHAHEMHAALKRFGTRVRVVLPNPEDDTTMAELARRFGANVIDVRDRVRSALIEFYEWSRDADEQEALTIFTIDQTVLHTYYRVDDTVMVTPYHHGRDRRAIPTLVLDRYGTLGRFFDADFDEIVAHAKRVQSLL